MGKRKKRNKLRMRQRQVEGTDDTKSIVEGVETMQLGEHDVSYLNYTEIEVAAGFEHPAQVPVRHSEQGLEHAPDDVFDAIFTKLDVKGIAVCRRVCTRIRKFIDSPGFARQWNKQQHKQNPVYISRQDEKCKAVGDLREGCHRFLNCKGTGHMKLMTTTHALMCFLEGDRQLVVVNPLTGQVRRLPRWATEAIVSVGIHFDGSAGECTVIAAAEAYYTGRTLYTGIYHSATGSWSHIENRNTSYSINKTSPIVWFEGAFCWTVGDLDNQLILKFDESRNKWINITPNGKFSSCYKNLSLVDGKLFLGHQWRVHNEGVGCIAQAATPLSPAKSYVVCYSDTVSGKMVFQMIGDHSECYKPDENDIFTRDYIKQPKHCYTPAFMRFEFTYGLGI